LGREGELKFREQRREISAKAFEDALARAQPGKWVKLDGWGDAAEARQLILEAIERCKAHAAARGKEQRR
jgi:inorganic pyrophosphatase